MKKHPGLVLALCSGLAAAEPVPKNIILFIGDGMGIQQLTAAKAVCGRLEAERCPVAGLATTWPAGDRLTTDSAAAATTLATGFKTVRGALGTDPDGKPLETLFEVAEKQGKSTGVATTCSLTHATPAAFMTHVPDRKADAEIARQITAGETDVLFGGGLSWFDLTELQKKMAVVTNEEGFRAQGIPDKAAALLAPVHPPRAAERNVSLRDLTAKAIEILSRDPDGFILMVEGSQIDWACHNNDATNAVLETLDFNQATAAGLDFAEKDGNTLVIITADHETGGFALLNGRQGDAASLKTAFTHGDHSASMVPVFAYGPGSRRFSGILDNTDIGKSLIGFIRPPAGQTGPAGD